jgi:hypothetical protein
MQKGCGSPSKGNIEITDPLFVHHVEIIADKVLPHQRDILAASSRAQNDLVHSRFSASPIVRGIVLGSVKG